MYVSKCYIFHLHYYYIKLLNEGAHLLVDATSSICFIINLDRHIALLQKQFLLPLNMV